VSVVVGELVSVELVAVPPALVVAPELEPPGAVLEASGALVTVVITVVVELPHPASAKQVRQTAITRALMWLSSVRAREPPSRHSV
jgi:hypothetical protein